MRIEAIRGCNLASLEGDFEIDFTKEPLRSAGIYAITGRTGSGKTTILDTICLALFDRTPRGRLGENVKMYDGISMRDSRMIMRKGTNECYAEVDFVSLGGKRYRSRWETSATSQRGGTGDDKKRLRESRMTLRNLSDETDEPGKKKELLARVSELIGFTFEQFTRSVMLAQGDFATFLRADRNEKAELLEKLTGTEIYSLISMNIYTRCRTVEQELHLIEEQLGRIQLRDEKELVALRHELAEADKATLKNNETSKLIEEKLKWLELKERLDREVTAAQKELTDAQKSIEEASERYALIERIDSVQEIRDTFNSMKNAFERIKKLKTEFSENSDKRNELATSVESGKASLSELEKAARKADDNFNNARNNIAEARKADTEIKIADKLLAEHRRNIETLARDNAKATEQVEELIKSMTDTTNHTFSSDDKSRQALLESLSDEISRLRSTLVEGEPCPVCGSLDHGDGKGNGKGDERLRLMIEQQKEAIESKRLLIEAQKEELEKESAALNSLKEKRGTLLNGVSADKLEAQLLDERNSSQQAYNKASERLIRLTAELESADKLSERLQRELAELQKSHEALSLEVRGWIEPRGITQREITDLLSHDIHWLNNEKKALKELQDRATSAQATLTERHRTMSAHLLSDKRPDKSETITEMSATLETLRGSARCLAERKSEITMILAADKERRDSATAISARAESLRESITDLQRLNELFGSASGDKFKSIAQGYTLELLLTYSNIHLKELSGRYRLSRVPDTLILEVIDLDMLNERRPVNSLSGGESFLVSLSLALGLSSLSGGNMKVESLFIDEGFGSLDAETMRSVLDSLEKLRATGRKIGIISHVAELSERIPVRIEVKRKPAGGSRITIVGDNRMIK